MISFENVLLISRANRESFFLHMRKQRGNRGCDFHLKSSTGVPHISNQSRMTFGNAKKTTVAECSSAYLRYWMY
jgi:hypothetical protein